MTRLVDAALRKGDVRLAYQPVVYANGSGTAFHEGLVRIFDDQGRLVPANCFMADVESLQLGRRIDRATLKLGLADLKANPELRLAINLSAETLHDAQWLAYLDAASQDHPDIMARLILEVTETSDMGQPDAIRRFMQDCHAKSITFALDDFGAGYSALHHLPNFDFDILKIDGAFARDVDKNPDNQALNTALISLAHHFKMTVVAEAVETWAEAEWLIKAGVDCLQGYYFGAPEMAPVWHDGF
jgi:EAL domain-containing protein (putative c-di-GMP-specific phosphodiesterase class I)